MEDLEHGVASNGLRYGFYRVESESAAICIAARGGSSFEPPGKYGIAHLTEHMIFRGNEYLQDGELDRAVELSGGEANAYTTRELILLCAEFVSDSLARVAEKLFLAVSARRLVEGEFERERAVVEAEVKGLISSPESRIYRLAHASAWGDSHLGRPIEGYPETVANISKADVEEYKASVFSPERMSLAIVGRISRLEALRVVKLFSQLEPGGKVREPETPEPRTTFLREERGIEAAYAALTLPLPPRSGLANVLARLRGVVFNLEAGATSILFKEVREERGLAYGFNVDVHITSWGSSMSLIVLEGNRDRVGELFDAMTRSLERALRGGYPESEWREGRRRLYRFYTRREAISNMERADALSAVILFHEKPFTLEDLVNQTLSSEWSLEEFLRLPRGLALIV
ncbi:probable peptidase [Aeropyrum pernix K1]|uniref:Probable peptidase n=2 Tax=Aeropyrum pernix TaxID=56636 RepID=Q9YFN7_AERPE|nr:pitrilysin family protein [Aeropyrum pernix]BAA79124.2 probable peptidase [Aeropyrum pernix K1]